MVAGKLRLNRLDRVFVNTLISLQLRLVIRRHLLLDVFDLLVLFNLQIVLGGALTLNIQQFAIQVLIKSGFAGLTLVLINTFFRVGKYFQIKRVRLLFCLQQALGVLQLRLDSHVILTVNAAALIFAELVVLILPVIHRSLGVIIVGHILARLHQLFFGRPVAFAIHQLRIQLFLLVNSLHGVGDHSNNGGHRNGLPATKGIGDTIHGTLKQISGTGQRVDFGNGIG